MNIPTKLPQIGQSIFTKMSMLATEYNAINLSQGFPDFDCADPLKKLVTHYMNEGFNQYAPSPGLPQLRQAIAKNAMQKYGVNCDEEDITITSGATQALFAAITCIVKPGDEVILIEPAYDSYKPVIQLAGGMARSYELSAPDYKIDWTAFAKFITIKTRLIIINNPHNPTGKVLEKEDLIQLQKLVQGTDIVILSDEVYEQMVFDGKEHWSVLRFPELRERSFITYSFGKTFHATGWKMGYCIAPPALTKEFRRVHQFIVFSVNTPIQYALANYITDPATFQGVSDMYEQKRNLFMEVTAGSRLKPIHCEGSYFMLFDYSDISDEPDTEFAIRMTKEFGVAAIPVSPFYSSKLDEKVIRLCFAKQDEVLRKAGELLCKM